MTRRRRASNISIATILAVFATVGFMTATGLGLALSSRIISVVSGHQISGISNVWRGAFSVSHIAVTDGEGTWLELTGLSVDLDRRALLGGTLRARSVVAAKVEVKRRPVPPSSSGSGGALPLDIDLDRIEIADVHLMAPVAGAPARFSGAGRLRAASAPTDLVLDFDIHRIDETPGQLRLDLAFAPDRQQLTLNVRASEPRGGVVATLLDIPGRPALALQLEGSGSLDDFQAELELFTNGEASVRGTAAIAADAGGHRLRVNLDGRIAPYVPSSIRPLLAGESRLSIDGSRLADAGLVLRSFDLRSATSRLRAAFRAIPGGDVTGELDLAIGEPGTRLVVETQAGKPLELSAVRLTGVLSGAFEDASWRLRLDTGPIARDGIGFGGLGAFVEGSSANLLAATIPFRLEATVSEPRTGHSIADAVLDGPVSLAATGGFTRGDIEFEALTVSGASFAVSVAGAARPAEGVYDATITGSVSPDLNHPVARLLDGEPLDLSVAVSANRDMTEIEDASVSIAAGKISGAAVARDKELGGEVSIQLEALSRLYDGLGGGLTAELNLGGTPAEPRIDLSAKGHDVTLDGEAVADLTGTAGFSGGQKIAGTVSVQAHYLAQPLTLNAEVATDAQGRLLVENADMRIADAFFNGEIRQTSSGPDGDFRFAVPDIGVAGPFLGRHDLAGSVDGGMAIASDDAGSRLVLSANVPRFQGFGVVARGVRIAGDVADLFGSPVPGGGIQADGLNIGDTQIDRIDLNVLRDTGGVVFDARARSQDGPLSVAGRVRFGDRLLVGLEKADVTWRGVGARLVRPTVIAVEDGAATLDGVAIGIGDGQVSIAGIAGPRLDLRIGLASISASVADAFALEAGLAGDVSGTVTVSGQPPAITALYDLTWQGASAGALREVSVPPLAVRASGSLADRSVGVDFTASGGDGIRISARGDIGLDAGSPLAGTLKARLPFGLVGARLAQSGLRLTGDADISAAIGGSLTKPVIEGSLAFADATFVDTRSNLVLRSLDGRATLAGDAVMIDTLAGEIASGGKLSASGTIGIRDGFPADLTIRVADGRYADGRVVSASFDAGFSVTGPLLSAPVLGGEVRFERADITLPESLPGGVDVVAVEHRNASSSVAEQAAALNPPSSGGGSALTLDVSVSAPRRIFVRGRGIDAEFGGEIRVRGPASQPDARGTFTLVRGRMDVLARRLAFTSGTIGFSGSLVPEVDFAAQSKASDATVTIRLAGPATDPEISVSSSPALPEDEAFAQLIFGRSARDLSPIQIAQLADALASLGRGGTGGALDRFRRTLGVDTLDITPDESGQGAAVSVGRYVNDRTFIGVKQGTRADSTRVTIDLDITDEVKIRGEAGANGTTSGGIFFERDY